MTKSEAFAAQLAGGTRDFFLRMNEILESDGLVVRHGDKSVANRITYFPDTGLKQQPLILRFTFENNAMTAELKLNFIDSYSEIIEQMPEHIKAMLRSIRHCCENQEYCDRPWVDGVPVWIDGTPNCGLRRTYTLGGERHRLCSYKYYFMPDVSNPNDVEYYAAIIKAEVAAAKSRKKHNTSY